MNGTEMKASLLLTLEDQLSGGVNRLMEVLDRLIGTTDRLSGTFGGLTDKLDGMFSNANQKAEQATRHIGAFERSLTMLGETAGKVGRHLDGVWAGMDRIADKMGNLGALAAGVSVVAPVEAFAGYEDILRQTAVTERLSGPAADAEVNRLTRLIAGEAQTSSQSSESIAKARLGFASAGVATDVIDKIMGQHAMAATAYRMTPEDLEGAVLGMIQTMHIPEADILPAIGAMATASKSGRFKVEDFSRELPGIFGQMATIGMTGRSGADFGFAALEIAMKNANSGGQSAANFFDGLRYTMMHREEMNWKKYAGGIDIDKALIAGEKHGKNPIEVYLDLLHKLTAGKSLVEQGIILNTIMPNSQSESFFAAMLQHYDDFVSLRAKLDRVDGSVVETDFQTERAGPAAQLRLFHENVDQIGRVLGEGFTPSLSLVSGLLGDMKDGLVALNEKFPQSMPLIEELTGDFLEFGAAIGVISLVAGGPVAVAIAAIGGLAIAADELYRHWGDIKSFFGGIWDSFNSGVDKAVSGMNKLLELKKADANSETGAHGFGRTTGSVGHGAPLAPPKVELTGHLTIGFDGAGNPELRGAATNHPGLTASDNRQRDLVVGRP